MQCLLALAALHAGGRWVKMVWDREETFLAGYKRHAAVMRVTLGADADGTLRALTGSLLFDAGPYAHLSGEIMALALEHAGGPYRIPHTRLEGSCAYTNNPVGGAFRGFGVLQSSFAIERLMDALAARLGRDPAGLRLQNALGRGEANAIGVTPEPGAGAADFLVYTSVPDMGQGNASAFVTMAAQALHQPPEAFALIQPDTRHCLPAGSSSASRTTYTFGNALLGACRAMEAKLRARAALALLCDDPARLVLSPGLVSDPATGAAVPLARLGALLPRDDRLCVDQFVMAVVENPPDTGRQFKLGFPHRFYSHGACLCAGEVDELTGRVRLSRCVVSVACGRVLSLEGVTQQVQGAAAQGIGLALFEDPALGNGCLGAGDLSRYLIPTALDLPDIDCLIVADDEPTGPLGLRGMGEVGIHGPGPAIAQALCDAAGLHITRLPVTPEDILSALGEPA